VTFDDVRKTALAWPEVEDGTSYGSPALKVRKKMLVHWWRASQKRFTSPITTGTIRSC
jgi:hypothetical protein